MKKDIEVLAPAASYEGMRAAMNAGCDAVYIGGNRFGARAYADNADEETLLRAIDEAHIRGKKLYLTVNTLLKERELSKELYRYIEAYYRQGLDAVIVQDVGVMHFIHRHFPELAIHASTQMTLTMAQGANLLKDYGVTRLVTARELSFAEIRAIRENTELEIETFVHGALCYCYSGQCLMSSIIGGRSGNRGRCAQPCRMPYQFYSDKQKLSTDQERYLLSPKDINTIAWIPELVEAGVDSFKIEGRMKRPEYAAAVASLYRRYIDLYRELGKERYTAYLEGEEFRKDMLILQDVYNRGGFSDGYGKTYHGKSMMSMLRPNHSGVPVGTVKEVKSNRVTIALTEKVNAQDILDIRSFGQEGYEFTLKDPHAAGELLYTNVGRRPESVSQDMKATGSRSGKYADPAIHTGDMVYRTKNNELLEKLAKEYLEKDGQQGLKGILRAKVGDRLSLTVFYDGCEVTADGDTVMEARNQPMTREKLTAPVLKTGDTLFFFEELEVEADENCFVPVAWLNDIRREALRILQEKVADRFRRSLSAVTESEGNDPEDVRQDIVLEETVTLKQWKGTIGITVLVQTQEQFATALAFPEINAIYAEYDAFDKEDMIRMAESAAGACKGFYPALPHICRLAVYQRLDREIPRLLEHGTVTGFLVRNLEEITLLQSLCKDGKHQREIILNHNVYTFNKEAKAFWTELGITRFTAPVELKYQELRDLGLAHSDMVVYGYLPLMVTAQCLYENTAGCRKTHAEEGRDRNSSCSDCYEGSLVDRLGKNFTVKTDCRSCYNIIYNGQVLSLHKQVDEVNGLHPDNIRLDFIKESPEEMQQILKIFIDSFRYGKTNTGEISDYTTGHFKRGVE